jgi:hypothetical protein
LVKPKRTRITNEEVAAHLKLIDDWLNVNYVFNINSTQRVSKLEVYQKYIAMCKSKSVPTKPVKHPLFGKYLCKLRRGQMTPSREMKNKQSTYTYVGMMPIGTGEPRTISKKKLHIPSDGDSDYSPSDDSDYSDDCDTDEKVFPTTTSTTSQIPNITTPYSGHKLTNFQHNTPRLNPSHHGLYTNKSRNYMPFGHTSNNQTVNYNIYPGILSGVLQMPSVLQVYQTSSVPTVHQIHQVSPVANDLCSPEFNHDLQSSMHPAHVEIQFPQTPQCVTQLSDQTIWDETTYDEDDDIEYTKLFADVVAFPGDYVYFNE